MAATIQQGKPIEHPELQQPPVYESEIIPDPVSDIHSRRGSLNEIDIEIAIPTTSWTV